VKRVDIQISAVLGISKRVESTTNYIFSFLAVLFVCLPVLIVNLYIYFFSFAHYVTRDIFTVKTEDSYIGLLL
jgi:hypothetical protein